MEDKEIIEKILPKWFKEKYKLELETKTPRKYWIRAEDIFQLINDLSINCKKESDEDE